MGVSGNVRRMAASLGVAALLLLGGCGGGPSGAPEGQPVRTTGVMLRADSPPAATPVQEVTTTWVAVAGVAGCVIVLTGSILLVRRFIGEPKPRTVPFPAGDDDDDNAG